MKIDRSELPVQSYSGNDGEGRQLSGETGRIEIRDEKVRFSMNGGTLQPAGGGTPASRYNVTDPFFGTVDMNKADTPTLRAFALLEHLVNADLPVTLAEILQYLAAP